MVRGDGSLCHDHLEVDERAGCWATGLRGSSRLRDLHRRQRPAAHHVGATTATSRVHPSSAARRIAASQPAISWRNSVNPKKAAASGEPATQAGQAFAVFVVGATSIVTGSRYGSRAMVGLLGTPHDAGASRVCGHRPSTRIVTAVGMIPATASSADTRVGRRNASVPRSDTPMGKKNTPGPRVITPVEKKNTAVPHLITPVGKKIATVPRFDTPVGKKIAAVPR
jgi:hypothetical protein